MIRLLASSNFNNKEKDNENAPILLYLHGGPGSPLGVPLLRAYSGPQLEEHLLQIYLEDRIQELKIPLLCITGKEDVDVPWYLVEKDILKYGGEKTFILFKNGHHMVFVDEENLFVSTIVKFLES